MCKTCNGTGGINIAHSWGVSFHPCPDTNCNRNKDDVLGEAIEILEGKLREMEEKRRLSA
ncbi:hypothetical protein [Oceanobacillus kapialis]|uniref:Uncharacterized protein n=1 Tax=Oceanobacillus kapialis TaxID=481353 RepID=A0ABW5PZI2_9BACI